MTDYNAAQRKRNIAVGAFVIIGFAAFLWMIAIFGELPLAVTKLGAFRLIVNFPSAPGIQQNTPVMYLGYQVGRVLAVSPPFLFEDPDTNKRYPQIKVTLLIDDKFDNIPANSEIVVMKRSMGSSYIEIQPDFDEEIAAYLQPGMAELQGGAGAASEFFPKEVQQKLEDLVDSLTALTGHANDIIGDDANKLHIKQTLANITEATAEAKSTLLSIRSFSDTGAEALTETAGEAQATLESIRKFSDTGSDALAQATEHLDGVLTDIRNILTKVEDGEGTAARLLNDGRLYENLLDSSQELQLTLEQLKKLAAEAREKGIKIKW